MRPKHHPISLRLKIDPQIVDLLDNLRTSLGLSMNEAVNITLANALEAKGRQSDKATN